MNPLLKKEIRLLLPGFLIGVALTFANAFWKEDPSDPFGGFGKFAFFVSFVFCPAVAVFTALNSFGAEISAGTFSMLLSQPVSRRRIWQTKTSLLAAALIIGGFLWCAILCLRIGLLENENPLSLGEWRRLFSDAWLLLLVIYSGALWTVLLFRQVAAAFWFTLLIPGAIAAIILGLWPEKYAAACEPALIVVLLIYSLAGFWFARWLFMRAQDAQWTGGTIVMPEMRRLAWMKISSGARRFWRPRPALLLKEFQLHQSQFVLAGALALLHLGVLAEGKFGHVKKNSSTEFIIQIFWGLWLIMPMLVGAAAVAEERKMGTLEGQLCLPVKRRTQFATKFLVVLLLSALFGVLMPLLLEGTRILPDIHLQLAKVFADFQGAYGWQWQLSTAQIFFWDCAKQINQCLPLLTLAGMATAIGAISFYASTFARNTLQTLGPAVLCILVTGFVLVGAYLPEHVVNYPLWRGWLVYFIGVPLMTFMLIRLAFWNYKQVVVGWRVIRRNLFMLAAALMLVTVVTTAIYHRVWEKLTPLEPTHGAAQFTLSNPPTLHEQWNTSTVRLPDGRLWTDDYTFNYAFNTSPPNPLAWVLGNIKLMPLNGGHFLEGSNWVSVTHAAQQEQAGIRADGTLWVSENPARRERLANGGWKMTKAGDLVRFGSEANWSSLAWNGLSLLLVKSDGTLWRWGVTNWNYNEHSEWPGLRAFKPLQLGTESNWAEVFLVGYEPCLRKTDGSVWTPLNYYNWNPWNGHQKQTLDLEPGFSVERASLLEHGKWRSTTSIWGGSSYQLGVSADGTFRIWAERLNTQSHSYEWTAVDLQFGKDTNWLAVAASNEKFVTLKNDGTLWLWNFHHDNWRGVDANRDEHEMLDLKPVRLGTHSDWIAIAGTDGGIISLATDGSFWYWPQERPSYFEQIYSNGNGDNSHFEPLLDMSRKPQLLGNVFGKAD
jgi:ABC-type transport system involved in multi-copper enzyme maturation permease subunit